MKILMVHNSYQQPGGEDVVFQNEVELLASRGHRVRTFTRHNEEITRYGIFAKATLAARTIWAWDSAARLRQLIKRERPQIAHFHNTFPLISPAAYYLCRDAGIPVVQSLHNPRLICPAATLYRDGKLCTECLGRTLAWPGIRHGCYQNSRLKTAVVTGMTAFHASLNTWTRAVNAYVVFTNFYRKMFSNAGLPSSKIHVKPHFVSPDPGLGVGRKTYALYIGRLAPEKGALTLLAAWKSLQPGLVPLKVRGEGPLLPQFQSLNLDIGIELVPYLERAKLTALIQGARFLVWPSEGYYETFGLVAIEAFACGVPVIASRTGVMAEIVQHERTGLHFAPGDARSLAASAQWAWQHPQAMAEMGANARAEYLAQYSAERNHQLLMAIYAHATRTSLPARSQTNTGPVEEALISNG